MKRRRMIVVESFREIYHNYFAPKHFIIVSEARPNRRVTYVDIYLHTDYSIVE